MTIENTKLEQGNWTNKIKTILTYVNQANYNRQIESFGEKKEILLVREERINCKKRGKLDWMTGGEKRERKENSLIRRIDITL
ncbi:hypothetical protein GCM10025777_06380 [Membranihabitans marinus]